ncbi:hypothetical protein GPJ56_007436 [Histomonas meleagridis]|uniref:uncharacterized protein n=1 Tax=Histomonas meleagridis TaxID=135588 RepID=UPI003559C0D3|nr:hypothetical protein GPJ56_007436 [Histomonas meleagridis]KAH0804282.1 hypothetical protein GO595_003112 [Histomonas meleagridis]
MVYTQNDEFLQAFNSSEKPDMYFIPYIQRGLELLLKKGSPDLIKNEIRNAELANAMLHRTKDTLSIFQKEKFAAAQTAILLINERCNSERTKSHKEINLSNFKYHVLNPVFVHTLDLLKGILSGNTRKFDFALPNESQQLVFFSPSLSSLFRTVLGYSPHGYVAASFQTIQQVVSIISNQQHDAKIDALIKFANFSFTILKNSKVLTPQMVWGTVSQHIKLLENQYINNTQGFFSAARLLTTLILASKSQSDEVRVIVQKFNQRVTKCIMKMLKFWLSNAFGILDENWLELPDNLGNEPYYYTLKNMLRNVNLYRIGVPDVILHLNAIQHLEKFFDFIFEIDFLSFQFQLQFQRFIHLCKESKCITPQIIQSFEELPNHLKAETNIEEVYAKIMQVPDVEIDAFIDSIIPSDVPFNIMLNEYNQKINEVNAALPICMQLRSPTGLILNFINPCNVKKLSQNAFVLEAMTNKIHNASFIVERVESSIKASNLSAALYLFNQVLLDSNPTIIRDIKMPSSISDEIGNKYIIYNAGSKISTIGELYSKTEGAEDALLHLYTRNRTRKQFFFARKSLVSTFAVNSFLRFLFNVPDPADEDVVLSSPDSEKPLFPVSIGELTNEVCRNQPLTIPPSVGILFGPNHQAEITIKMCAIAQSFLQNIESVESCLEILIAEENKDDLNLETISRKSSEYENRILSFCPPQSDGATIDDSFNWYHYITSYSNGEYVPSWFD